MMVVTRNVNRDWRRTKGYLLSYDTWRRLMEVVPEYAADSLFYDCFVYAVGNGIVELAGYRTLAASGSHRLDEYASATTAGISQPPLRYFLHQVHSSSGGHLSSVFIFGSSASANSTSKRIPGRSSAGWKTFLGMVKARDSKGARAYASQLPSL